MTPSSVTRAATSAAGVRSWTGFRMRLPSGAIRVPATRITGPGRPSSIVASSPVGVAGSIAVVAANTSSGTPASAAARASG